jgi:hypothetical protein
MTNQALSCWTWLKLPHDGLEREFKFFKELEGGVCMMCAPGDLEKSGDSEFEQSRFGASKVDGSSAGGDREADFVRRHGERTRVGRWWGRGCCSARDNGKC